MGERGEGTSRNMYRGPMDKAQGVGLKVGGGGGWGGWWQDNGASVLEQR